MTFTSDTLKTVCIAICNWLSKNKWEAGITKKYIVPYLSKACFAEICFFLLCLFHLKLMFAVATLWFSCMSVISTICWFFSASLWSPEEAAGSVLPPPSELYLQLASTVLLCLLFSFLLTYKIPLITMAKCEGAGHWENSDTVAPSRYRALIPG